MSLAAAGAAAEDVLVFTGQRKAPKELMLVGLSVGGLWIDSLIGYLFFSSVGVEKIKERDGMI